VQGWNNLKENYSQNASCRCMYYPGTDQFECMPIFNSQGTRGQIIDDQVTAAEETLKAAIKKGFSILADCYVAKDMVPVLQMLMDAAEPVRVRLKAADMIGDFGELEAIEPLRNLKVGNEILQNKIDRGVQKIHERHFTRECPYCAEVIKKRAKICKHCGKDLTAES